MPFNEYYFNKKNRLIHNDEAIFKFILGACYFTSINSTSKISVASGGITPPAPALP